MTKLHRHLHECDSLRIAKTLISASTRSLYDADEARIRHAALDALSSAFSDRMVFPKIEPRRRPGEMVTP